MEKTIDTTLKQSIIEISTNTCYTKPISLERMIYTIRGMQVMIDKDLAGLYGVETKALNQAVKRNIERFPDHFMFQLTKEEYNSLWSQIVTLDDFPDSPLRSQTVTLKNGRGQHSKYLPYVFTEQGVSQLSAILKSKTAVSVSIRIMDAFVAMRKIIVANTEMYQRLSRLEYHQLQTDEKIDAILSKMEEKERHLLSEQIFDTGCTWDAWEYVSQLIRSAKKRIALIDNYVDERVLTLLTKRDDGVSATIHTRYTQQFLLDLQKHNEQYPSIQFVQLPKKEHDRFLIIDDDVYLLGASVKDMGKGLCAVMKMKSSPELILEAM